MRRRLFFGTGRRSLHGRSRGLRALSFRAVRRRPRLTVSRFLEEIVRCSLHIGQAYTYAGFFFASRIFAIRGGAGAMIYFFAETRLQDCMI